jgi:hypothetical protein
MSTFLTSPTIFNQYAESTEFDIEWNTDFNTINSMYSGLALSKPLLHIARQPKNDIKMKSWYLQLTGFNFENIPDTIAGIQLKLSVDRHGRVFDDTVQLCYQNELIGANKCTRTVDPVQFYGGITDTWEIDNLSAIVQDPSFGIVLRFKSHPDWPHKTTPTIRFVELQIY